ncbi:MAG: DNA repair protein RadA, partial [Nocardioides sp.]|nr:DNA repair protein RadA [Nocardioides sp.]
LRLAEAARLGFRIGVAPSSGRGEGPGRRTVDGMTVVEVSDLHGALSALGLAPSGTRGPT